MPRSGNILAPAAGAPPVVASVLFIDPDQAVAAAAPAFFTDVNLDQVIAAVAAGRDDYDLAAFWWTPLHHVDQIWFRQQVWSNLDGTPLAGALGAFATAMHQVRAYLAHASKVRDLHQYHLWFLNAADAYTSAVTDLQAALRHPGVTAAGLRRVGDYLTGYLATPQFVALRQEAQQLRDLVGQVRYCLRIGGGSVTATRYADEPDYATTVLSTFAPFAHPTGTSYLVDLSDTGSLDHVESQVLGLVARLFPEVFDRIAGLRQAYGQFVDTVVTRFDREIQFYLSYLDYITPLRQAGLLFCLPHVGQAGTRPTRIRDLFDLALAGKLHGESRRVVVNDAELTGGERALVVSGPNQGGKTTFARAFAQIHYLAALGLPVPATAAEVGVFDQLYTHFERRESAYGTRGKLQDDLLRMRDILTGATDQSVIICNEMLTSTTLRDAITLGTTILRQIIDLDARCVCVTFIDEWSTMDDAVVSMVAATAPGDPSVRTFRIERRPADGLAHAITIAEKYRLTRGQLAGRLARR